ncbi:helix-turn-helix transcriptional regulator [Abiotrophia defectiva]|uniref:helix-turn-helix domain-containing protein n=1 Tax=Abiotrophia defectiva TaxID=46125 RepID=UPI0028D57ED1|nr:helix-turn-helix transcriptional regulator [Abiotrophia defectiva]
MSLESLKNRLASQYPDFTLDLAEEAARQEVALKLVKLRLERGLSQAQMAEKLGLRQANLSRLESGQANPTVGLLGRIVESLNYEWNVGLTKKD